MDLTRDAEIDPSPLTGKRVAIVGYGNQGRAQALNLHDSGIDVVVGLRQGSASRAEVEASVRRSEELREHSARLLEVSRELRARMAELRRRFVPPPDGQAR